MNLFEGAEIITAVAEEAAPAETKLAREAFGRVAAKTGLSRFGGIGASRAGAEGSNVISFEDETKRLLRESEERLTPPPKIKNTDLTSPHEARIKELVDNEIGFELLGRLERGTHGAYMLRDEDGVNHIFKLVSDEDVTPQINMSARAAEAVNSLATTTPRYEQVRFTPSHGSWYMQEVLSGTPSQAPTHSLVTQLAYLNDRQAGKAIAGATNWNDRISGALHSDSFGWKKHIADAGKDGAGLVARVEELSGSKAPEFACADDIVHGDFQHFNALVSRSDRLTGYVDWEGAGRGDRTIDLSRLLYDAYVSDAEINYKPAPQTLAMLSNKIAGISGHSVLKAEMSYWILQVANFGAHVGQKHFAMFTDVGHRILTDMMEVAAKKSA